MTFLDGLAIGFWLGVVVVIAGPWAYGKFLACVDAYHAPRPLDSYPKVPLSTYMQQYRVDTDPMESPPISADERRRILLAQARFTADLLEKNRVLTREESNEVDAWVGLR